MRIKEALKWATKKLNKIKTTSLDAEVLLSFDLNKPKEYLFSHPEISLTLRQTQKLKKLVEQRSKLEPVAYLTNHKEFYGLDFYVNKNVLVPRPETEMLVDEVIKVSRNKKINIADIGTGSGCIAITLAKHLPKAKIFATDICKRALKVAQKNAKNHKLKINFFQGDLINPLKNKKIDIIIANLPYIPLKALANPKEYSWGIDQYVDEYCALKFEPKKALAGGADGLKLYEKIFQQIKNLKKLPSLIIMEFGYNQAAELKKLIKKYIPGYTIQIKKDLSELDRILILKKEKARETRSRAK